MTGNNIGGLYPGFKRLCVLKVGNFLFGIGGRKATLAARTGGMGLRDRNYDFIRANDIYQ